jgi:hypothetical protein
MSTDVLKLVAGLAWAALAISSAAPVNAKAFTGQSGNYGNCSANYTTPFEADWCGWTYPYAQQIKFVTVGCNQGCTSSTATTYTEFYYVPGRRVATLLDTCGGVGNLYELSTCAC